MPDQPHLRASDADRDAVIVALQQHYAEGRLELAELSARIEQALTATTQRDLAAPLADLPVTTSAAAATSGRQAPRAAVGRSAPTGSRAPVVPTAFRAPLAPWLLTAIICVVIWAATSFAAGSILYFWPVWVVAPWGVALLLGRLSGRPMSGCAGPRHAPER